MRQTHVLKPLAVAASLAVLAVPSFAHSESGRDRASSYQTAAAAQPE